LAESWKSAGSNARDIFLLQRLEPLLQILTASIPEVEVENVTVIDGQSGNGATKTASFIEQLRHTTGIDLTAAAQSLTQRQLQAPSDDSDR
jgi:flotillin